MYATMKMKTLKSATRLVEVLDGLPSGVSSSVKTHLMRLTTNLDALGRLNRGKGNDPLIDAHTLKSTIRSIASSSLADELLGYLKRLPGNALRDDQHPYSSLQEVAWFELAEYVPVFDTDPTASIRDMRIHRLKPSQLVDAVVARFPSLEPELVDSKILPAAIRCLQQAGRTEQWLDTVTRQLGWWAAVSAALLCALANSNEMRHSTSLGWPLDVFVMCSAVGGWTLTIVANSAFAPV
jgi:hypothetical protein